MDGQTYKCNACIPLEYVSTLPYLFQTSFWHPFNCLLSFHLQFFLPFHCIPFLFNFVHTIVINSEFFIFSSHRLVRSFAYFAFPYPTIFRLPDLVLYRFDLIHSLHFWFRYPERDTIYLATHNIFSMGNIVQMAEENSVVLLLSDDVPKWSATFYCCHCPILPHHFRSTPPHSIASIFDFTPEFSSFFKYVIYHIHSQEICSAMRIIILIKCNIQYFLQYFVFWWKNK